MKTSTRIDLPNQSGGPSLMILDIWRRFTNQLQPSQDDQVYLVRCHVS
jgi:hypothetical protein